MGDPAQQLTFDGKHLRLATASNTVTFKMFKSDRVQIVCFSIWQAFLCALIGQGLALRKRQLDSTHQGCFVGYIGEIDVGLPQQLNDSALKVQRFGQD